jgi:lipopolysaccharide/colanic/teichoic acid biosynthesis glycosyltransferase
MKIISETKNPSVRFHIAQEYEKVLAARIINDITGSQPTVPKYNIALFRNKLLKRLIDIIISVFFLTIGSPLVYLIFKNFTNTYKKLALVFKGKYSFIGLYSNIGENHDVGKDGIIGLAHISRPERLSQQAIKNLNNYYLLNFSLSLDLDIFIKYLFRNKSGY